jgi:hypothetical protein
VAAAIKVRLKGVYFYSSTAREAEALRAAAVCGKQLKTGSFRSRENRTEIEKRRAIVVIEKPTHPKLRRNRVLNQNVGDITNPILTARFAPEIALRGTFTRSRSSGSIAG